MHAVIPATMESLRKCRLCGLSLTEIQGSVCPTCARRLGPMVKTRLWLGALIQFGVVTTFILVLRLPRFLILFFGLFSLFVALLASVLTRKPASRGPSPQRPIPNSAPFWIVSLGIALGGLVLIGSLLFGFVTFINSWNSWHRYEGQPFHRAEFVVEQDYYRSYSKHADLYASGMVEGHREWTDLVPYLRSQGVSRWPHGREEVELSVPPGTSIPIYLFPGLKGRSRVRLYSDTPPAEEYHRRAMHAANYGLIEVSVCALIIFLLLRIRAAYVGDSSSAPAISSGGAT
jgi:hypothetical protein